MKINFVGNLAGGSFMLAKPLSDLGVNTQLFIGQDGASLALPAWEGETADLNLRFFHYDIRKNKNGDSIFKKVFRSIRNEISSLFMLPKLFSANIIISYSCALFDSRIWRWIFASAKAKPYIACAAGSDIREMAEHDMGKSGRNMRQFFRSARIVLLLNLDMVKVARRLKLENAQFFPFAVDTEKYAPDETSMHKKDALMIFMPSNIDWGATDNAIGRNSTKGNNRLIAAFTSFIKAGYKGKLILLDRGPDRHLAKRLVAAQGIQAHVVFLPEMQKDILQQYYNKADIVADQFDIGAFGTTTLEAMACAKPVMLYVNNEDADLCYPERPPILNVRTEEEILQALLKLHDDVSFRQEIGQKARAWVIRHHDSRTVGLRLKQLCENIVR